MSTLLECRKLTKRFKTKEVLKQIDLKLESGHINVSYKHLTLTTILLV